MKRIITLKDWKNKMLNESKYPNLRSKLPSEPHSYKFNAFHATSLDYWPNIQRYGLIPGKQEAPGQDFDSYWKGKAIYFHLSFPMHELENSYDQETREPFTLVIEAEIYLPPEYIVPDEDVSTDVNYAPKAIENKESIAVGYITPPKQFKYIHMIDTIPAREWASKNINKRYEVKFHKI